MSGSIKSITDIVSVWKGVVVGETTFLIAGSDILTEERIPHTYLFAFQEKPAGFQSLEWTARDIVVDREHPDAVLVMGIDGQFARFHASGEVEELAPVNESAARSRGTLLCLRWIGDELYACGGNQQVYRMGADHRWSRVDEGISRPVDGRLSQFEFVAGTSRTDGIYVGGARGEAWCLRDEGWQELRLPTHVRMTSAVLGPDGNWWIAGQLGLLLRGKQGDWQVLHTNERIRYFWDLVFVGDRLLLATERVLYEWTDGALKVVDFSDESVFEGSIPFSFRKFFVERERLYSFGSKDVLVFEEGRWRRHV